MNLALFDLDNTLLAGDSDFQWAQHLIGHQVVDREVYEARNVEFYEQYKDGTLDIHEFLDFQLKPLSRHARSQLDAWHREFMEQRILPIIAPGARELVNDLPLMQKVTHPVAVDPDATLKAHAIRNEWPIISLR